MGLLLGLACRRGASPCDDRHPPGRRLLLRDFECTTLVGRRDVAEECWLTRGACLIDLGEAMTTAPSSTPPQGSTAEHARLAQATGLAEDNLFESNPWYEWGPYL